MLQEIEADLLATRHETGCAALSGAVVRALQRVPREDFVPTELRYAAYLNTPLPIGHAQTISQPFIVALMTQLLQPRQDHTVLEIGTGSGYQSAVLAQLFQHVYTVELIAALAQQATHRFTQMQLDNISVHCGNGHLGWPEHAPYDAIIVTAAAKKVPQALLNQLKPGGRLVIPVGSERHGQNLRLICKDSDGGISATDVLSVVFVPFVDPSEAPLA